MQITEEHDKWFKGVLRNNGIAISDNPDPMELLMIENDHKVKIKHFPFALEVHIDSKRVATYVSDELDYL